MGESSFREVLKNRFFLLLWFAQIFSQFADKMFFLLMVVLITKDQFSNSEISGLTLVFTIPAVFFGSIAGVFVDRWNKKNIMIGTNIFRTIFVLMLPFSEQLLYLYLITFLVSTMTQFFAPAETSMIPTIVEKKDLLPANSLFMGTMLASVVLGFALGAPLISRFEENVTDLSIAAMYAFSAFLLIYIKVRDTSADKKENDVTSARKHFFKEFKEGLLYVIKSKVVLFSLIRLIIIFSAFAALSVLAIGFVNDVLYLKPVFFGYLLALTGLGMALGAGFTGKFGNKIGKEKLVFTGFILTGIFLIVLAFTNHIASITGLENITRQKESSLFELVFALVVIFLIGFSAALSVIPLQTILQEIVDEKMRGKVFGVQNMVVNTAMTVPMVLAGVAADLLDGKIFNLKGVPVVMILTGILILAGGFAERAFGKVSSEE